MSYRNRIFVPLALLLLAGCGSMQPRDFQDKAPRFVPEEYFLGSSQGTGMFFDRFGDLKVSFTVDLEGTQKESSFELHEKLSFDNGEKMTRTYVFTKVDDHRYTISCPDLVGPATVESYGNALKLTYTLRQTLDGEELVLDFDDWMFLQPNGIVLNRARASKWGISVGDLFMSIRRTEEREG